jgi:cytochrome P450/NADPH-cytochrome P450 reductase
LLKNPETYIRAQQEVDRVLGTGPMEAKHLSELPYLKYSIFEALRFMGPISLTSKRAIEDTVIGGKYRIKKSDVIMFNLKPFHHDPKVW